MAAIDQKQSERLRFRPGLPRVLSAVCPGLGQCYTGRWFAGALWLFVTIIGYVPFILPGIVLHLLAVTTAGFRAQETAAPE